MNLLKTNRVKAPGKPLAIAAAVAVLSIVYLLLCALWTEEFRNVGYRSNGGNFWQLANLRAMWSALLGAIGLQIYLALTTSFATPNKRARLAAIISFYFATIMNFAGFNYVLSAIGDYKDADAAHSFYTDANVLREPSLRNWSKRAFRGIEDRLWDGPEQLAQSPLELSSVSPPTAAEVLAFTKGKSAEQCVKFRADSRLCVFFNCLHMSIITMTTVGYGDIVPANATAKVAADAQALIGVILLVVALGVALGMPADRSGQRSYNQGQGAPPAGHKDP